MCSLKKITWVRDEPMERPTVVRAVLFFFSSRRRHTRFDCDWSSDVCSSDLDVQLRRVAVTVGVRDHVDQGTETQNRHTVLVQAVHQSLQALAGGAESHGSIRSEERRVGKECRSRWSPYH